MRCYLCNSDELIFRPGVVRDDPKLRVLECLSCKLVFLNSFAHIHEDHYSNSGMHGSQAPNISEWINESEADDERRFNFLKKILVNKKVLDFGSGACGFLLKCKKFASHVAGVELEKRIREFYDEEIELFSNLDLVDEKFDVITSFHVFEHLEDPRGILTKLAEKLSNDGKLIIEVPNSEDALLSLYENNAFNRFTYWSQHLYLFNPHSLRILIEQSGLRVHGIQQVQRYSIANHMYWLSKGLPGGHKEWPFLDNTLLNESYALALASIGKCDTIIAIIGK